METSEALKLAVRLYRRLSDSYAIDWRDRAELAAVAASLIMHLEQGDGENDRLREEVRRLSRLLLGRAPSEREKADGKA